MDAIAAYEQADALTPGNTTTLYNLALEQARRIDDAIARYDHALKAGHDNPVILGVVLDTRGAGLAGGRRAPDVVPGGSGVPLWLDPGAAAHAAQRDPQPLRRRKRPIFSVLRRPFAPI